MPLTQFRQKVFRSSELQVAEVLGLEGLRFPAQTFLGRAFAVKEAAFKALSGLNSGASKQAPPLTAFEWLELGQSGPVRGSSDEAYCFPEGLQMRAWVRELPIPGPDESTTQQESGDPTSSLLTLAVVVVAGPTSPIKR